MTLKELFKDISPVKIPKGFALQEIQSIVSDSRQVTPGSLFVALPGTTTHGCTFIDEAIQKGAVTIVSAVEVSQNIQNKEVCILGIKDPLQFLKGALLRFYGNPSTAVKVFGVTGTNGKTTITYLLESILNQTVRRCGVIGTVNYRIGERILISKNTTPGLVENQIYLAEMTKQGVEYCAMEVSSHALDQGRVDLINFSTAIFTNLTGDHLDYHKDMENYFEAKSILFKRLSSPASAVINVDDPYGKRLLEMTREMTRAQILTYGIISPADVCAVNIDVQLRGSNFTVLFPAGSVEIKTKLIGQHNIYNILACVAACLSQGITIEEIKKGIEILRAVAGRLQKVEEATDIHVFVDYAHTEDALKNVLMSIRRVSATKIILVFGCGGNRDKTKRAKMGKVASFWADWSIVTSDNPRNEDPDDIIKEIIRGFVKENYEVIVDRQEAIVKALSIARKGDVVLIAGKGHEDYQIFKDKTIHFDDREVVRDYFLAQSKMEIFMENRI